MLFVHRVPPKKLAPPVPCVLLLLLVDPLNGYLDFSAGACVLQFESWAKKLHVHIPSGLKFSEEKQADTPFLISQWFVLNNSANFEPFLPSVRVGSQIASRDTKCQGFFFVCLFPPSLIITRYIEEKEEEGWRRRERRKEEEEEAYLLGGRKEGEEE